MSNGKTLLDHYERGRIAADAEEQARSDRAENTSRSSYAHALQLAQAKYAPIIEEWAWAWAEFYDDEMSKEADEDEEEDEDE